MNHLLRWLLFAAVSLSPSWAWAEGSKQLTPNNTGTTADLTLATNTRGGWLEHDANFPTNVNVGNVSNSFLKPSTFTGGANGFSEDHRMYIRIKAGEVLHYGVHRINSTQTANQADLILTLRYGAGAGIQVQQTTLARDQASTRQSLLLTNQAGVIVDAAQNQAGPLPNAGGYNALTYTNNTGSDQDFYVEFTQVNEAGLAQNERFSTYDFWDFTVRRAGVEQPGRLFSKQWAFSSGATNAVFSSTFNMYPLIPSAQQTNRYYVKKFELAGINPQNYFRFVTNSRGTTASATDFTVSRKSQTTLIDYPEYNNFVQNPDPTIWPSATPPSFTVKSVYPYCGGTNGALAFTTTGAEPGTLFITIDLDGTAGYQPGGRDVVVEKNVPAGTSTTVWNGLDGLGNPVPSGTAVQLGFKSGNSPVNFPMVDDENNVGGFTIQDVRPTTGFDFLFWDDSNLSTTFFPVPQTNLSGTNSSGGVHGWGTASGAALANTDAGNNYVVNTFTFGNVATVDRAFTLSYNCDADGDGVANANDIDWDNDGIGNTAESGGVNPVVLTANGVPTYLDALYVDPVYGAFRDINGDGLNDIFDLDLDGKPNFQDVDADGDGIPDAIEANGGTAPANYDATTSRITGVVGANGMPDAAETTAGSGITRFPLTNSDNNGRADFLDIDADNDGIPDNIEAQPTATYRAPTGTDTDGDGLDDRYDPTPGGAVAAGVAVPLTNTDGVDLPDYRDTDSDNDGRLDSVEGWDTNNSGVANTLPSNADADQDGLDDAYDIIDILTSGSLTNATNGRVPTFYPDVNKPGGDRDWRQVLNVAPVATNVNNSPVMLATNGITAIQPLAATDADDAAATLSYTITALPPASQGVLYVNGVLLNTTNFPGLTLTAAQAGQLQFDPAINFSGNATFTYTAKDPAGLVSNLATYTIPVTPAPDLATTLSGPTTAAAGQIIRYVASTTNNGTINAATTQTTITLPSKPATVVTNGTYDPATGVVTFNNGTLAPGATVINTVAFAALAASETGRAASTTSTTEGNLADNNGSAANANVTTVVSPTGAAGTVAPCATAGKDGNAILAANPNAYYPSIAAQTRAAGSTSIQVSPARGATTSIAPGDLLLVIQMQGADIDATNTNSYGDGVAGGVANGSSVTTNFTAGTYEYVAVAAASATVTAAAGGTITLASGLKNSYVNAVATATTGQRTFQVIRVPQYSTLTLSANLVPTAWDGRSGGIIALDVAGQLNMAGFTIDASGKGFRGGAGRSLGGDNTGTTNTDYRSSAAQNAHATKGEGLAGTPRYVNDNNALLDTRTSPLPLPTGLNDGYPSGDNGRGAPGNAGGGGTDGRASNNDQNTGGGGGANGGSGGRGGNAWNSTAVVGGEPGAAFPAASSSRLVLGGGGGAGSTNDGTGTPGAGFASSGAAGGGLVLLRVGTVAGVGSILANGDNANNTVRNDGSGGGGAGGSILVTATNSQAGLANLTMTANGGTGGTNTGGGSPHGPGGGGGGGIILTNGTVASASTASGAPNGTTAGNSAFGAEAGVVGIANPAISNSIANSVAGAGCVADVATTISGPLNANAGSTVTLSVTFANNGALAAANTTRVVTFPANTLAAAPTATGGTVTGTVGTGFTVTYPALNPSAAGSSATFSITYTAPATGSVTATATTTTSTAEGGLTANNTSAATTFIGLVADVTTALTGPASVNPGQPTGNYTATFTNEGPSTATGVTRRVTLPAGATAVVLPAGATLTGNVIDFDGGVPATVTSGTANSFIFSFTPAAGATGSLAITSNVTTTTSQGANQAPDASTLTATVTPAADVVATIVATTPSVAANTPASAGTPPRFTATFNNNGATTAAGVVATVQLPTGLTNVTATNGGVYNSATGVVTYAGLTSIAPGTPTTSVITFDAPLNGPVVGTATVSTTTNELGQTANNLAAASMTITPTFDLTTTLTGPASAVPGNLVTLAVTTSNNGPSAATNAVQTLQLATGLSNVYVSNGGVYNPATTTQTIVSNGVSYSVPAGGVIFPTFATLPAGQTVTNSVSYTQPTTAFAPSALVTPNTTGAGDTNPANNTANLNGAAGSTTLTNATPGSGIANAYTRISSSVSSTTAGNPVTLTVVTGNNGPATATGVKQTVQILPGYTASNLQVNGAPGTLNGGTGLIEFGSANLTYNPLTGVVSFATLTDGANGSTSGTSVSNTITFPATAAIGSNGQLLAMATVSTTNTDPVPADNVASVALTLVQRTDLTTAISGPASATAGQPVQYTATFTNNGPMAATGVTETVQLPSGLATPTVTDGAGNAVATTYNASTGLLTLPTLNTVASGTTQAFRIAFVAPGTNMTVRSSVNSTSLDAVTTNNAATATTTVLGSADLTTTVSGPATAVVGNPVTYSVLTANNGISPAPNAVTSLQLAAGFTPAAIKVNGQTGTPVGGTVSFADGSSYDSSTGLLTFPTAASLANGASTANYVTFLMPNPIGGQVFGTSSVSSGIVDPVASNNASGIATSIVPANASSAVADLTANVSASASSVAAGSAVTFTATYGNAVGSSAATNVRPTLQLQPGLGIAAIRVATQAGTLSNGIITFPGGSTYNQATGVVSFPVIASQAAGAGGNVSYAVQVNAPSTGSLTAVAVTTSDTSEPNTVAAQANNVFAVPVTITPSFDVTTSIAGPAAAVAGTSQTYTVTTTNNGPSPTNVTTTQTVSVPAGQTPTNITNGGVYSSGANTITWTVAAGLASGSSAANSFTLVQPAAGVTLNATVSATGDTNTGNNTASITTTAGNQPPLAFAVVNTSQSPMGNTANTPRPILSLQASDPENALSGSTPYTIVALPTTAQGILYYNTGGGNVAISANQLLTAAQASALRFQPASGYVGNASFTYSATDAAGNASPVVSYTIPVAQDQNSVYARPTTTKGGNANQYVAGDVLAYGIDPNTAVYNASGAIYNTATGAAVGGSNGLLVGKISPADSTTLASFGILFTRSTGLFTVSDPTKLPRGGRTFPAITVTTIDQNGGVNTNPVVLVTGGNPLPVELSAFTATAKNLDALLAWTTASEKNSAYFDVERSLNGADFVKIDQVLAQGSSTTAIDYARPDLGIGAKASGLVYYRLKQVDLDGTSSYSPVRTVRFSQVVPAIALYPNPATSATRLDLTALPAGTYQVRVLDATGRVVLHTTLAAGLSHALDLNTIASGTYTLLVRGQDGSPALNLTKRLVKE